MNEPHFYLYSASRFGRRINNDPDNWSFMRSERFLWQATLVHDERWAHLPNPAVQSRGRHLRGKATRWAHAESYDVCSTATASDRIVTETRTDIRATRATRAPAIQNDSQGLHRGRSRERSRLGLAGSRRLRVQRSLWLRPHRGESRDDGRISRRRRKFMREAADRSRLGPWQLRTVRPETQLCRLVIRNPVLTPGQRLDGSSAGSEWSRARREYLGGYEHPG